MAETAGDYLDGNKQSNITLSDRVRADYRILAAYQGIPYGTLLRQILEMHWANPGTQKLIQRAKDEQHLGDGQ
jgi:predicted DNA binding CopG/RHH family protein